MDGEADGETDRDGDGATDGEADGRADGVGLADGCGGITPLRTWASVGYQRLAIFWKPPVFGCTPSTVSATASKPVHWSTSTMGDCAVDRPAAQPGSALLNSTMSAGQVEHAAALIGMI